MHLWRVKRGKTRLLLLRISIPISNNNYADLWFSPPYSIVTDTPKPDCRATLAVTENQVITQTAATTDGMSALPSAKTDCHVALAVTELWIVASKTCDNYIRTLNAAQMLNIIPQHTRTINLPRYSRSDCKCGYSGKRQRRLQMHCHVESCIW